MSKLPSDVLNILAALESAGHEAFIVGGCVRDIIRGVIPKDFDIATSAVPEQVKAVFPRTADTGIKHGTITVLRGSSRFEVTTYRVDGEYLDARRPEAVTFTGDIKEDLSRRDFTMNAIAYNPAEGFIDPFNGRGDIEKKLIRCVGEAACRFGEDALRMLRAVRFAAVLGFSVDYTALEAISKLKENLDKISAERIREELGKLICGNFPDAVCLLEITGLLPYALRVKPFELPPGLVSRLERCPPYEPKRLALFLAERGDCETILYNLRFAHKTVKEVSLYVKMLPAPLLSERYEIKKLLRDIPRETFENLLDLKEICGQKMETIRGEARDIIAKGECFSLKDLAVNGDDLARAGVKPGKEIGEILESLLDEVMRNPGLNHKEILMRRFG